MRNLKVVSLLLTTLFLLSNLSGCAHSTAGNVYKRGQARQVQNVKFGTVQHVRLVRIEGTKSSVGSTGGAVIGGIAGTKIGGGRGTLIASILGAIAGGVAGAAMEEGVTRRDGLEITVKLDDGNTIAVVQAMSSNEAPFQAGQRVRVLSDYNETRVTH